MGCRELRWSSRFCLLQCSTRGLAAFPPTGLLSRAKEEEERSGGFQTKPSSPCFKLPLCASTSRDSSETHHMPYPLVASHREVHIKSSSGTWPRERHPAWDCLCDSDSCKASGGTLCGCRWHVPDSGPHTVLVGWMRCSIAISQLGTGLYGGPIELSPNLVSACFQKRALISCKGNHLKTQGGPAGHTRLASASRDGVRLTEGTSFEPAPSLPFRCR